MIEDTVEAKVYLGHIKQIKSDVVVKRYVLSSMDSNIEKMWRNNMDILKVIKNVNLCEYFDVELMKQDSVYNH